MKKLILILIATVSNLVLQAQNNLDIFNTKNDITWLGVDYSEVKFIGPASGWGEVSTKTPTEMRDKYFPEWNELIISQPKQFPIADAVNRAEVNSDITITADMNAKMNKKEIFSENIGDYQLVTENMISDHLKKYNFKGKSGIGMLMMAEGMSKGREEASYWVVFVDMSSKKMLLAKRMTGKSGGFGFRNYWASPIKNILKDMRKEFKRWEK